MTLNSLDAVAIEKAGNIPGWFPYLYDTVEGGIQITGSLTTKFVRGPRKGETKWLTKDRRITVFIKSEELRQYEKDHPESAAKPPGKVQDQ